MRATVIARLASMLNPTHVANYASWGDVEAYELQALLLLELLYAGPLNLDRIGFSVRYIDFLRPRHPTLGPRPLCAIETSHAPIAIELKAFRAELEKATTPP